MFFIDNKRQTRTVV